MLLHNPDSSNIFHLVADMYPNAQFHGMDLSPIQPDWVPENVLFVVDDIEHEAGWTYPENSFDYIHIRHTCHSIKNRTELWSRIYKSVQTPFSVVLPLVCSY